MPFNLLPRNDSVFSFFQRQSDGLREASRLLVVEATSYDQNARSVAAEILQLEHQGDYLIRELQTALNNSFITTPEPEDARSLGSRLDDVLDGIEDAAYRIAAYRVSSLPANGLRLCEIIEWCVGMIAQDIDNVGVNGNGTGHRAEIRRLEQEADRVARTAIAELFQRESDALRVLKLKEIYELLEGTIDRCEDVADLLESISAKNL
jgi:uncharacterized protein